MLARRATLERQNIRSLSILKQYGLDDWKFQVPIGMFLAIPVIHYEVLMLSEETQLVGSFMLFCGLMYKYTGDSFAEMLDKRSADIQAEHSALEDEAIEELKDCVKVHEQTIEALSQISSIPVMQRSLTDRLIEAKHGEMKHNIREKFVKFLDDLVFHEEQANSIMTQTLLAQAADSVTAQFESAEIKEKALNEAIKCLESPSEKSTLVPNLFIDFLKEKSSQATAAAGTEVPLSPEAIASLNDEISAIIKREGAKDISIEIPTSVKM